MEKQDVHFRHILLYYFRKGKNASQAQKKLCAVYGDEALKERQCRNWFERFRSGDFSLKNAQRSGRPVEVDETHIKAIIDSDRHSTTRDIAEKLNVSHTCIEKQLKTLAIPQDIAEPPGLSPSMLKQRQVRGVATPQGIEGTNRPLRIPQRSFVLSVPLAAHKKEQK
ncbi:hypothetical protein K0M31_015325 [Melipona bicolor]|uniref:Mos1 transposase HTH domain-containing protein n=1 Tax=Melipona bicolor TaxID=60889 RepID=A0AA40FFY4_9HYME|nr:hypothetical protein K0M31_015325 [Melipona bicolor]